MKHEKILEQTLVMAKSDPNVPGFLGLGSITSRKRHKESDVDAITNN
jgi:hypothetical protein